MALVTGLDAANSTRVTIVAGLLIFALADNLTDSLSIHVYQEAERFDEHAAFRATVTNFATRLGLSVGFVLIVMFVPPPMIVIAALVWGGSVLAIVTTLLARYRGMSVRAEIGKHFALAVVVIAASRAIGSWLLRALG